MKPLRCFMFGHAMIRVIYRTRLASGAWLTRPVACCERCGQEGMATGAESRVEVREG